MQEYKKVATETDFMGKHGQGAIESKSASTAGTQLGQGATEYLVLLAVVLIVALVSVALLGFFPGMASDAQLTQTQTYWKSAQPIAIIEMDAIASGATSTIPYLRVRNTGAYPIRITKVLGNGQSISQIYYASLGDQNMSSYFYLAPGEENYFGWPAPYFTLPVTRGFNIYATGNPSSGRVLYAGDSLCQFNTTSAGTVAVKSFGFEYIEYIEGQQITKQQIGKPLVIKCRQYP
jgi:hypothetical protein